MLFAGWEVRTSRLWSQFFPKWTDPKPVNNLFIFFKALINKQNKKLTEKTHASITVTVVRDKKIWHALRTNQIVGFVTVPLRKNKMIYLFQK